MKINTLEKNKVIGILIWITLLSHFAIYQTHCLKLDYHRTSQLHMPETERTEDSSQLSSSSIDYNKQLSKLNSVQFSKAVDINQRVLKVQSSNLTDEQQLKILGNFSGFTQFNTDGIDCSNITQNKRASLLWRTTELKSYLKDSLLRINFIQKQNERDSANQNIQNQILYLTKIQEYFQSGCKKKINIKSTYFVSNPNANNWILGDWTYQQFVNNYIKKMNQNPVVTKCPIERPYFSGKNCINCDYPNKIWDMKIQKCSACPYPLIVNIKTRKCVSQIHYVNNLADSNLPWVTKNIDLKDAIQNFNKQKSLESAVVCPYATPFILNEGCSYCPDNSVYILEQKKCGYIPYNMYYDNNIHKIVQKLDSYQTNFQTSKNIQQNLEQCPKQMPYFDDITCINCEFPSYYNQRKKSCELCANLDACQPVNKNSYASNSNATNLTGKSTNDVKAYIESQKKLLSQIDSLQCPPDSPYYVESQRKCISCPSSQSLFNISNFSCTACQTNSKYNSNTYLCQSSTNKTNLKAPKLLVDNITKYQQELKKSNAPQCPISTPYWSKSKCITCPQGKAFNTSSFQCVSCQNGYQYDKDNYNCSKAVVPSVIYKNNAKASNLWIKNVTQYNSTQANNNTECSISTPYSLGDKCTACQKGQIFNTSSLKCTICPDSTTYSSSSFTCEQDKKPEPVKNETYMSNLKYGVPPYYSSNKDKLKKQYENASKNGTKICAFQTPFFDNSKCMKCAQTYDYFNLDTKKCENCQKGSKFNSIISECQQDPSSYYTNLTSKNLIYDGQPIAYYEYNQKKAIQAGAKQCEKNNPYYTSNNKCESCSTKQPYFNLLRRKCTVCPEGSTYVQKDHECVTPIGDVVTPQTTLEKSLANFFVD